MPAEQITVALIRKDNLKLPHLSVEQQEVQLKIEGDTDPSTLQRLRDHILPSVQHHMEVVNKYIATADQAIGKAKSKQDAERLGTKAKKDLELLVKSVEPKVKASAEKFFTTDNATKQAYANGRYKFWTVIAWVPVTFTIGALVGGGSGPVGWALTIKSWVDLLKDAGSFLAGCLDAYQASQTDLKQLREVIAEVRKIKPPKKVEAAHLDKLKLKTKAYSARILGLEMEAKAAAKKLDAMLKAQGDTKGLPKEVLKAIETSVQNQIECVTSLNEAVDEGKKVVQSASDHIKNIEKKVTTTTDWTSWLGTLGKIYEASSTLVDVTIAGNLRSWGEAAFGAAKYLGGLKVDQLGN